MTHESLINADWQSVIDRLGGADRLEQEARDVRAFRRVREVKCAVDLLRLTLAYCLGTMGLRLTAAWAEATGLASLSNVALLKRLRHDAAVAGGSRWPSAWRARRRDLRPERQSRLIRLVDKGGCRQGRPRGQAEWRRMARTRGFRSSHGALFHVRADG